MNHIEAMKQALEALELHAKQYPHMQKGYTVDAITSLRQAIAEAEKHEVSQEPVAWMRNDGTLRFAEGKMFAVGQPFYTSPPKREAWRNAAIRIGEELSSVGPNGYYDMTAQQWLDWAMEQEPKGKTSLPHLKREPLTDEQILRLVPGLLDCLCDPYDYNNSGDDYASVPKDMIRLARAIEAAHGIKENT